jgi:uncharacterized protein (TIGR03435 family)
MTPTLKDIDDALKRDFDLASNQDVSDAGRRVWHRLKTPGASPSEARLDRAQPPAPRPWRAVGLAAAAVLAIAAAIGTAVGWVPSDRQSAEHALFRVVEGDVRVNETVRANGGAGAVLALVDGSSIEIRANSELAVERATDGIRIRLRSGAIIVNAATQRAGHLYVQTNDVTVSVVGTVFAVNADDEGSRVAVLEGEVRVQRGPTEQKLRPGEQLETNPSVPKAIPVREVIAWSRNAGTLLALLPQAPAPPSAVSPQGPQEPMEKFEVSSIRPSGAFAPGPGARGAGSGDSSGGPGSRGCVSPNDGHSQQIDPRRLAINRATLFQLIVWAYPVPYFPVPQNPAPHPFYLCGMPSDFMSGGPSWLKTDVWDVQAGIPEGLFSSTPARLDPRLRRMLQALLVERFSLVIRRETRELPVYLLKVERDGPKFNGTRETGGRQSVSLGRDGKPLPPELQGRRLDRNGQPAPGPEGTIAINARSLRNGGRFTQSTTARNLSMDEWARHLFDGPGALGRPVLDRTGLPGRFDFHFDSAVPADTTDPDALERSMASYKLEVVKAMGFALEESRAFFDVWVIVSAEKPTEN